MLIHLSVITLACPVLHVRYLLESVYLFYPDVRKSSFNWLSFNQCDQMVKILLFTTFTNLPKCKTNPKRIQNFAKY